MIRAENIVADAGDFRLDSVSFEVPTGAYGILMGKSASGKTTLLEVLCGLIKPVSGHLTLMGKDLTHAKPAERDIGYIPQNADLFLHLTVEEQVGFALRVRNWSKKDIRKRVDELAELLMIRHLLDRKPFGLSGGEAQRISLGRALSFSPSILCLDEPLSALDQKTRLCISDVLHDLKTKSGVTFLHITHDVQEAERLGDVVIEMKDGRIVAEN